MTRLEPAEHLQTEQPDDQPANRGRIALILLTGFIAAAGVGLWLVR